MIVDGRTRVTSARREVEALDHKLTLLRAEIARLEQCRELWAKEAEEIREARVQYHRNLHRTHKALAEEHLQTFNKLLKEKANV